MTRSILAIALLSAAFFFTRIGEAAADCPRPDPTAQVSVHVTRDATGTRVVVDTPIHVCGRPPAPTVAYLAPALRVAYQWADVELDFLPLILRSVRHRAFGGDQRAPFEPEVRP